MSKAKYSKLIKIMSVILMVCMLLSTASTVFAGIDPNSLVNNQNVGKDDITKIGSTIVGILSNVGIVVAVVVLIILGIKYMIGSAQEKAEYKKTMIPYLIGAVLIFAASFIAGVVKNIVTSAGK